MILSEIANIYSGCTYGREYGNIEKINSKKIVKCLMKNSIYNGRINEQYMNEYCLNKKIADSSNKVVYTKKGDILLKLSNPQEAIVINNEEEGYLVTNYFALIRCKKNYKDIYSLLNNKIMLEFLKNESNCKDKRITINVLKSMPVGKKTLKAISLIDMQQKLINKQNYRIYELLKKTKEDKQNG